MKIERQLTRQEIIHENFFIYLNQSGKTMSEYAKDNDLDRTIISKWKSMTSNMNNEHVYQAAKYFKIVVNDLFYTEKEKKKLEVLTDLNYDPVIAQQSITIKNYRNVFDKPHILIIGLMIFTIIIGFFTFLTIKISEYFILFNMFIFISMMYLIHKFGVNKKMYIINYTDEIYYMRENRQNKYKKPCLIFNIVNLFILISNLLLIDYSSPYKAVLAILVLTIITGVLIYLFSFLNFPYNFDTEVNDSFDGYHQGIFRIIISFIIFGMMLVIHIVLNPVGIPSLIISIISLILSTSEFYLLTKSYAKYKLAYKKVEDEPRLLFKEK